MELNREDVSRIDKHLGRADTYLKALRDRLNDAAHYLAVVEEDHERLKEIALRIQRSAPESQRERSWLEPSSDCGFCNFCLKPIGPGEEYVFASTCTAHPFNHAACYWASDEGKAFKAKQDRKERGPTFKKGDRVQRRCFVGELPRGNVTDVIEGGYAQVSWDTGRMTISSFSILGHAPIEPGGGWLHADEAKEAEPPKFKVGDRVREVTHGSPAIVVKVDDSWKCEAYKVYWTEWDMVSSCPPYFIKHDPDA